MKDVIRKTQEFKELRAKAREAIAPLVANRFAAALRAGAIRLQGLGSSREAAT